MASNPRAFKHPIPGTSAAVAGSVAAETPGVISAEQICAVKKDNAVQQLIWCGVRLAVRRMISADEFMKAADLILERCWTGDGYRNEMLDFEFRTAIVVFYSNAELPQDTEERWAVLYGTSLYSTIRRAINDDQAKALEDGVKSYMK